MPRQQLYLLTAVCLALGVAAAAPSTQPTSAPASLSLADVHGWRVSPLEAPASTHATVIVFVGIECPICNAYSQELNRIFADYRQKGIRLLLVDEDANASADAVADHARQFDWMAPVLLDPDHALARRLGAKITPEAVVLTPDGSIAYRGRIDDLYFGLARRRYEATTHELRDALDAVLSDKPVVTPRTQAIGCSI